MIDGVAMDLDHSRYQTFEELLEYCRRVASAVGMICIRIFRCQSDAARDYALHLGVALQLTNILRDVKGDLERGRLYSAARGPARGRLHGGGPGGRTGAPSRCAGCWRSSAGARATSIARAVAARPQSIGGASSPPRSCARCTSATLSRIERRGYDVFSSRVRVSKPLQALIALRQWLLQP